MISRYLCGLSMSLLLPVTGVAAQEVRPKETGQPPRGNDSTTLGLGVAISADYDGARDYRIIPGGALIGSVKGHDFRLNGPQLFVDAIPNTPRRALDVELGPVVGLGLNRTGRVSDPRVAALGEVKAAVELGLRGSLGKRNLAHRTDKLAFAMTVVHDVAGAHRSAIISPAMEYSRVYGRGTFVRWGVSADFAGKGWVQHNFGISAQGSAASGLRSYAPKGGLTTLGASMLATHSLSGQRKGWALFGIASVKRYQGEAARSPIIMETGTANQAFASFGVGYTF